MHHNTSYHRSLEFTFVSLSYQCRSISMHERSFQVKLLCCVTSRPAKYRDPLTGLPFATPEAFKLIREKYAEYLRSMPNHPAVMAWLSKKS